MYANSVLLVEEDHPLGPLIQKTLEVNGFQVFCASTTAEALRIWEETRHAIPVSFIDLTLAGGREGETLARQLQIDQPSHRVILTNSRLLWPDRPLKRLSYFAYLRKPFLSADLLRIVQRAFATMPTAVNEGA